jgi:hypothetical protein
MIRIHPHNREPAVTTPHSTGSARVVRHAQTLPP